MADDVESLLYSSDEEPLNKNNNGKTLTTWSCINPECQSNAGRNEMITADTLSHFYYGIEKRPNSKRKICSQCESAVIEKQKSCVEMIRNGESIFREKMKATDGVLIIDDSDYEYATNSSDSEVELDVFNNNLSSEDENSNQSINNVIDDIMEEFNVKGQVKLAIEDLERKMDFLAADVAETEQVFDEVANDLDELRKLLYANQEQSISELPPIEIIEESSHISDLLPPDGLMVRPSLNPGQKVYAFNEASEFWASGVVVSHGDYYTVRLEDQSSVTINGKWLAYKEASNVRIPVGSRCVAILTDEEDDEITVKSGIIAEPLKSTNNHRYLIFLDDGGSAYVSHSNVRVIVMPSPDVWNDVGEMNKEYIYEYLQQYPERPMLRLSVGQSVKTEVDGIWLDARVLKIDCSLALLSMKNGLHTEWLYRGSTRLEPLYSQRKQQHERKVLGTPHHRRRVLGLKPGSIIEYTRETESEITDLSDIDSSLSTSAQRRLFAKKSTASRISSHVPARMSEKDGIVFQVDKVPKKRREFTRHTCSGKCMDTFNINVDTKDSNPLMIPLLMGWERELTFAAGGRRKVFYTAPCGRRLCNINQVCKYIKLTGSGLEIDLFNFEWWLHVRDEFRPSREVCSIKDISYGKENVPISCVNSIDKTYPEFVEYSTVRIPQKNVKINTSEEYLTGCNCEDDCANSKKCECRQLTIKSTVGDWENKIDSSVGYEFKRLKEIVVTGIYECNKLCKCTHTCLNRVVQNPLKVKLQVFKTATRGWGIRALNDIPGGAHICNYVGNLYSCDEGNKRGKDFGDEYFADLDMIEIVEDRKTGHESDISDEGFADSVSDEDTCQSLRLDGNEALKMGGMTKYSNSGENKIIASKKGGLTPKRNINMLCKDKVLDVDVKKPLSVRKLFGENEEPYIMDAKITGNIGRYLNHSCNPNVFVQNVFVDTHDLRFPWVAFFTTAFVRAGQELCWDYNYEVGSIAGKEIQCACGAESCRGRLL